MGQQIQNPEALAGANGGYRKAGSFTSPEYEFRAQYATALCALLGEMNPADSVVICTAFLDDHSAGDPIFTAFGDIRADAAFWADCANPAELEAYLAAALKRLGSTVMCLKARKRLMVTLWASFCNEDRAAFLSRIDPNGDFTGRSVQ